MIKFAVSAVRHNVTIGGVTTRNIAARGAIFFVLNVERFFVLNVERKEKKIKKKKKKYKKETKRKKKKQDVH